MVQQRSLTTCRLSTMTAALLLVAAAGLQTTLAWTSSSSLSALKTSFQPQQKQRMSVLYSSSSSSSNIESFSLEGLENHEDEGVLMAKSLAAWLDAEWMPQEVHVRMGESVKSSYVKCRETGEHDLMTIMMTIADDLQANWGDYDKDAFVNAWDISNYVSDYLIDRSGAEGCECSSKIY